MSVELYNPVANPYAPGAGTPPPALVGRDATLDAADIALQRIRQGRADQHRLITGLRGVGKTVLLAKLAALGQRHGFRVVRIEAVPGNDAIRSLLRQLRRILDDLAPGTAVSRAVRSVESVGVTILGSGVTIERAAAEADRAGLTDALVDAAGAAAENDIGIMVAIDEAQMIDADDLRRLLAGVHRCGQDRLPLACVLAGLPNLVGIAAKAVTYAERMFAVDELGALDPAQVERAIVEPASDLNVAWAPEAIERIVDASDGYPFFVQTWAYHTWNAACDEPISAEDVDRAASHTSHALESSFFAARIARIPASEIDYVRALASLGPGPHRSGEAAAAASKTTSQVAAFRDRLIQEGVVYAPRYGWVEFAIPHFDAFVRRELPPIS